MEASSCYWDHRDRKIPWKLQSLWLKNWGRLVLMWYTTFNMAYDDDDTSRKES